MNLQIFQKGFNYGQDGRGNRLVYHLQGCNLACPWCSNPEGMAMAGGSAVPIAELLEEILSAEPLFFDGGGVTFTGGEPTVQAEALLSLLRELKRRDIHTALETNAVSPRLPELLPFVDQLMMDVKHYDSGAHREWTGVGNEQVVENLHGAIASGKVVDVRIPLIAGFNAAKPDIAGFVELFSPLDRSRFTVELLPYHEYGRGKWEKLGLPYELGGAYADAEILAEFRDVFTQNGIKIIKT